METSKKKEEVNIEFENIGDVVFLSGANPK